MAKNKVLPYVIFGVPLLVGIYFVYKAISKSSDKKNGGDITPTNDGTTSGGTTSGGTTSGGTSYTPTTSLPFKKGSSGDYVKMIQRKLNISADGKFGRITESKVKEFQKANNLTSDGIVGKNTWKALFGAEFPNEFKASASNFLQVGSSLVVPKYSTNQWD